MKISFYNSWVIVKTTKGANSSLDTEDIYTDLSEAQSELEKLQTSDIAKKYNLTYIIQTLDDYITNEKDNAYSDGQSNERFNHY